MGSEMRYFQNLWFILYPGNRIQTHKLWVELSNEWRWHHSGVGWVPNPIWLIPLWEVHHVKGQTSTQGECHVKTEVMLSQAKVLPETKREACSSSFPSTFRKSMTLPTPRFQISVFQNCETVSFCCSKPPSL